MDDTTLLTGFLDGTLDTTGFTHREHVQLTYLLLRERPLPEALIALRDGLRRLTARDGHPEKYHETITFAFAALVNERMRAVGGAGASWQEFAAGNADLLDWRPRSALDAFYDRATLLGDEARRTFLLPR
ncbi:MAG TPA: hypothetical protein VKB80_33360 [Kofleriaceae bacterium]|nr:hypothetical protein [Kofleriaceae bacterium]